MNIYIYMFLVFGALFGLLTYPQRHLFSEGPQKPTGKDDGSAGGRLFWVSVCTFLWPLMVVTGVNSALILAKRKRKMVGATR